MVHHQLPRRALVLFGLLIPLALTVYAQAQQRAMYVSVVDQAGNPVPGVVAADLVIREDKVAREIIKVEPATDPMNIALLVDNSTASEPFQRDIREALTAFITAVGADTPPAGKHQIALITLASRPTIVNDYSPSTTLVLNNALKFFSMPETGSYMLDGIIETSQGIIKRNFARPVIVVVTTEGMELSDRRFESVLDPLRSSGAALHVITIGRPDNLNNDRAIVLGQGTKMTGGRNGTVLVSTGLPLMMKALANEITHQYKVTYSRTATLIPAELVTVASTKPDVIARGTLVKEPPRALDKK